MDEHMKDMRFKKDFIFGAATAAYQIEGAWDDYGKGMSIWDDFTRQKGKIRNGDTAETACNHYHLYKDDVAMMKKINLDAYRFSVSWPRIFPEGTGRVNVQGMDFYRQLTDTLLEAGITPYATLFHWDLPLSLQKKYKGFESRDMVNFFGDYCYTVVKALGDRVKNWITINEPFEYSCFGHFLGYHAPGKKSLRAYFKVMHNLLMAHGRAMEVIKSSSSDSKAGITVSMTPVYPMEDSPKERWSAMIANQFMNHITLSPLYKKCYPETLWKRMRLFTPKIYDGDMELIGTPTDFLGINLYSREMSMHKWYIPFLNTWTTGQNVPEKEYEKDGKKYSSMGWEIFPDAMYEALKIVQNEYGNPPVIITENGAPFTDTVTDNQVHDPRRIQYIQDYLSRVHDAVSEGADVRGYFYWSLLDNFEWAEGLSKTFGLIHVNHKTYQRIIKDSGYWYSNFIQSQKK
jgi:beta-glucosidase